LLQERYATGTAQVVTVPLPDGSRIELGARSAVSVTYFRGRRDVGFEQGEARFSVASDKARPFTVATREGKVEVVGTVFTVSDRAGALSVQVEEGRVRFTPVNAGSDAMLLGARDKLTIRHGIADPITRVTVAAAGSWRDGWLTFENEPLAEALAVVNAYRTAPIRIADPVLAGLRLTGSFRATESKELVLALPQILPVDAVTMTDGAVDLLPRP
jgi:transmembrane sensor